jgi:tetratricopeptide (TPR) repeat protein
LEADANSPVVKLCAQGIAAEIAGKVEEAAELYQQAWMARADDYDACIAAHYVARVQRTAQEVLRWNREAVQYAEAVNDARVEAFYPSLYLNLGKAYEDAGNKEEAKKFYGLAEGKTAILPEGAYADTVRRGIAKGLERVSQQG